MGDTILVIIIVGAAALFAIRSLYRTLPGRSPDVTGVARASAAGSSPRWEVVPHQHCLPVHMPLRERPPVIEITLPGSKSTSLM